MNFMIGVWMYAIQQYHMAAKWWRSGVEWEYIGYKDVF